MKFAIVIAAIAWITVVFGLVVGWIMNIINLLSDMVMSQAELILSIAGIFIPPLGAICGWVM